jgi:hypothetical protein
MNSLYVKLDVEYRQLLSLGDAASPEQKDRRRAIACITAEVQLGILTKGKQLGTDQDTITAAEAWLEKMDAIYDPLAKTIWSSDDILDAHRVRKHIVEILEGFKVK